jgi:hypothetical protein
LIAEQLGFVLALARAGDPLSIPALRPLVAHGDPRIRLLAQLGLARAGDRDTEPVDVRLADEPELANYFILAARAGRLAIGTRALDYLGAQAFYDRTPPALRASCAWALGEHDADRARAVLDRFDATALAHFAAIVGARGGAFTATHATATPYDDRVAPLLGYDRWRPA